MRKKEVSKATQHIMRALERKRECSALSLEEEIESIIQSAIDGDREERDMEKEIKHIEKLTAAKAEAQPQERDVPHPEAVKAAVELVQDLPQWTSQRIAKRIDRAIIIAKIHKLTKLDIK